MHEIIIKILNLLQILLYNQTKPEDGLQRMNLCHNTLLKELYQMLQSHCGILQTLQKLTGLKINIIWSLTDSLLTQNAYCEVRIQ